MPIEDEKFNTHREAHTISDVDFAWNSLHHTIGTTRDQAAAGDHGHLDLITADADLSARIAALEAPPCAEGYLNANQNITTNVQTDVAFNTQAYDTDGIFDPATGLFTIQTTGMYCVKAGLTYAFNATGYRSAYIYKGATRQAMIQIGSAPSPAGTHVTLGKDIQCIAGDVLKLATTHTAGVTLALVGQRDYNWMTMHRFST